MADIKSADWNIWNNVPELLLWKAVALSLDLDPRNIQFNPNNWISNQKIDGVPQEFDNRLLVAEGNLFARKLPSLDRHFGSPVISRVALDVFAAWALQLTQRWQLPEPLAALANIEALTAATAAATTNSAAVTPPPEKPFSSRERETLLKLVIGMAMGGYQYDPISKRNFGIAKICNDLAKLDISVSDETVRKYLDQASELVPQNPGKPRP